MFNVHPYSLFIFNKLLIYNVLMSEKQKRRDTESAYRELKGFEMVRFYFRSWPYKNPSSTACGRVTAIHVQNLTCSFYPY